MRKVYGFIFTTLASGRTSTNTETMQEEKSNKAVVNLDDEFQKANQERDEYVKSGYPMSVPVKKNFSVGDECREIVFDATDRIFKLYPGDKISILCKNKNIKEYKLIFDQLIKDMNKSNAKRSEYFNMKRFKFFEEEGIDSSSFNIFDFIDKILEYGDLNYIKLNHKIIEYFNA